ncbi:FAD:protein FMN transferase [Lachnobacterium bovis]|uniref:FAD:protein FMN transferase n=1 Tax=Lachnobacterium bovis DSM 14045 TaxID=1122142 RepID=A0A1H3FNX4_9FIRM|nr:FAD:protein FMN transferase [Lachnobacterium bovis]SDX92706.1 thiamine biosynthesis lipoprotein [Lachnobacterium bovis DSM 14045]
MKQTKKRASLIGVILFLIVITFALSSRFFSKYDKASNNPITSSKFSLDTIVTITVYNNEDSKYVDKCFDIINKYDNMFSTSKANSDISKINTNPNKFVHVHKDTIEVLKSSIKTAQQTNGLFDPTIGKLTDLWNISELAKNAKNKNNEVSANNIPSAEKIHSLVPHINYKNIKIQDDSVMLCDSNAKIDLGGIAKGYIADKIKLYFNKCPLKNKAIINLGGNILTINKSSSDTFNIGIQKPFSATNSTIGKIKISNSSIVTSGIYERFFKCNNKIYHHILNTSTGYPVDNNLEEVTIITPKSTNADALSTSVFSMGLKNGKNYIESLKNTEAIFVTKDKKVYLTNGIKDFELTDSAYTIQ